jgi:hypothetical protein
VRIASNRNITPLRDTVSWLADANSLQMLSTYSSGRDKLYGSGLLLKTFKSRFPSPMLVHSEPSIRSFTKSIHARYMVSDNLRCNSVESTGMVPKTRGISEVCQAPAPGNGWVVFEHSLEVVSPDVVAGIFESTGDFRRDTGVGVIGNNGGLKFRGRQVLGVQSVSICWGLAVSPEKSGKQGLRRRHDGCENRSFVGVCADEDGHLCCCALVHSIRESWDQGAVVDDWREAEELGVDEASDLIRRGSLNALELRKAMFRLVASKLFWQQLPVLYVVCIRCESLALENSGAECQRVCWKRD